MPMSQAKVLLDALALDPVVISRMLKLDAADAADYRLLDYSTLPDLSVSLASVLPANHAFFQQNYFRARIQFRSATPNGDLV